MLATEKIKKVHIMEVGPRDGFQSEKQFVPTEKKIEIINALSRTGVPEIQITSFVHPKAIPQFVDAEDVVAGIDIVPGVSYRVMTPNMRGLQRALPFKDRITTVSFMLSVTESHNRANGNRSIDETLEEIARMAIIAQDAGFTVSGSMICSLGCPFEGQVSTDQLERVADKYLGLGITNMSLADTIGVANPKLVHDIASHMLKKHPQVTWNLHLHNTRDMALANTLAAMEAGMSRFDGGVAGLGGCPYAPGATGNIATEDMVNMLHGMGIETGIDLDKLLAIANSHKAFIPHTLDSALVRAGRGNVLLPAPERQQKIA
ncbi:MULTISPECIES: hydroxymethylglutaryl-CoA lyase [unclassified Mesorhizobium]|uniref:hydroxymethylglutaryl-CoA lyase n=1 Tax=unclassified Mesorhizobium TaxID=325217 RepID=UPI0011260064|nr:MULTISPECIES: hydroxymethylglutaryl-CoA lyase [unclassified Mesorhizobium]MBZ9894369.1 hydroxymethylglutaryl-CoA lyase [Mesorhizobium sp. BR1-1-6]TPN38565.1 hydroxymethylglutaryl-CoA lyase [Mesorhizobium sp. B1-1-6]